MDTQFTQDTNRQAIIDNLGMALEASPAHSNPSMDSDTEMDHWSVKLTRPHCPSMTLFYSMGTGLRRQPTNHELIALHDEERAAGLIPVKPQLIDILYCLIADSDALDYTFEEWCDNLGYDTDSRKAEHTFRLCCDQTKQIKRLLGDDFEAVQEALQDY